MISIVVILVVLTVLYVLYNIKVYLKRIACSHIPSPKLQITPLWFAGHALLLHERIKKYGSRFDAFTSIQRDMETDFYVLFIFARSIIFSQNIPMAAKILTDHKVFSKVGPSTGNRIIVVSGTRVFGPRGLLTEIGTEIWYTKRKVMDPAFHKNVLKTLVTDMSTLANTLIYHLQDNPSNTCVDIYPIFCRFALDIVCKCGFNLDTDAIGSEVSPINKAMADVLTILNTSIDSQLTWSLPWKFRKEKAALKSNMDIVHNMLYENLVNRLETQVDRDDMLSYIINANMFDESRSKEVILNDVLDDFFTFMVAGMETTAITLAFCMFYMLKKKDVYTKIRDEVDSVMVENKSTTLEDLSRLVYMEQVIKEAMRRHPPAQATFRTSNRTSDVCGTVIPKGVTIVIGTDSIHHRADIWEDPYTFDPDRFAPGKKIKPFTHMPFMAGPRSCIGKNFAMMEIKIVLSKLVQEFNFIDPYPDLEEIETCVEFTLKPKNGVHISFEERLY